MSSVHRQTFVQLVQQHGWTRGVELGVDKGILFRMLLEGVPNLRLTGVDLFPNRERSRRAFEAASAHADRADLLVMSTNDAARVVPDGSLDFVFIDAGHNYPEVREDIMRWAPKVREGGWVGGHDYHARKFPGVVRAVKEHFCPSKGEDSQVMLYPGTIWGVAL